LVKEVKVEACVEELEAELLQGLVLML